MINQMRKRKDGKDGKIRLIFTHNLDNPPIHKWIRETKKLLIRNEKAKEMGEQIQIATRQPKNLKKIVTGSNCRGVNGANQPPQSKEPGCFKCQKCKVACPILKEGNTFKSNNTGRTYPMRKTLTCDSSYIVYLATCKKCRGQYVGKSTQKFKKRHSGHKQEVKRSTGGLGHHYGGAKGCGYNNIEIQIIDQVENGDDHQLAECETYWQHKLRCYVENGVNAQCLRKEITRSFEA